MGSPAKISRLFPFCGAIAQLGERLVRNEEVSGSIPLSSTNPVPAKSTPQPRQNYPNPHLFGVPHSHFTAPNHSWLRGDFSRFSRTFSPAPHSRKKGAGKIKFDHLGKTKDLAHTTQQGPGMHRPTRKQNPPREPAHKPPAGGLGACVRTPFPKSSPAGTAELSPGR